MVHVFGSKDVDHLERDERVCALGTPWNGRDTDAAVVFHFSPVCVAVDVWTCFACGVSSGVWLHA